MSSELEDKYRTHVYELVNTLRAAMVGHSKQCIDPEYCRVCMSGGWELLDRIESDEDYDNCGTYYNDVEGGQDD